MCKFKQEGDIMKKLSLFAIIIASLCSSASAKHSVSIRNNASSPAMVTIVNNNTNTVTTSLTLHKASSIRLQNLDSTRDVRITTSMGTETIKALPDAMFTSPSGVRRPMMQGISATINSDGKISSARFMQ